MVQEYISSYLSPEMEKDVKSAIKAVGGVCNVLGIFLKTTSNDVAVSTKTGINRRSVAYLPRAQVPKEVFG